MEHTYLDLHMFEGEGGAPAAAGAATGDTGAQEQAQQAQEAARPTFREMLKANPDYDAEYRKSVEEQVKRRFKSSEASLNRLNALEPVAELIARQYGVDPSDHEALKKAIESDDRLYEEEAVELGLSVEQLKRMKTLERENEQMSRMIENGKRQAEANRIYSGWMQEAEQVKNYYPGFRFETEVSNPDFMRLLKSGVGLKHAYEVIHKDEIIGGAMQYTAQTVAKKVASDIQARGNRPVENGAGAAASSVNRGLHAKDLTTEEVLELARKAKKGTITRFG